MKRYRKETNCLNCGATVNGKFCSECGQENIETREPFWTFLFHSIGHYFHFDSKFINSLTPLITEPGKLTLAHINGKRAAYFPPVTMYLFISLFFFLILSSKKPNLEPGKISEDGNKVIKMEIDSLQAVNKNKGLSVPERKKNESRIKELSLLQKNFNDFSRGFQDGSQSKVDLQIAEDSIYQNLRTYENQQAKLPVEKRDTWLEQFFIKKNFQLKQEYGDQLYNKVMEAVQNHLPKMMFVLMPLFALILSLSFYKSKLYFIDHLVNTLHVHSFLFLLYITIELIAMAWPSADDFLIGIGMVVSTWYVYRAMRTVYQRSRWHTVFKLGLLGLLYFLLLSFGFIGVFAFSFISL
ncbi:MAG: hypothetical protein RLZ47_1073 [Bacteroidota bacterium]|jgi:hypothetical protein